MHRRDLALASYNPRAITEESKKKLRKGLEKHGLVQPLVFNKRTGTLVGGHQRTSQLDALHGANWETMVAVVDVDETREKELNLLLNNYEAQGEWDLDKLSSLLADEKIDLAGAGFDEADVYRIFGSDPNRVRADVAENIANANRLTEQHRQKIKAMSAERDDDNFYFVLIFKSTEERDAALVKLGLDANKFQNGRTFLEKLTK